MVPIFDSPRTDHAYDLWMEAPSVHEEDGCEKCHRYHREEGVFQESCEACQDEKCERCEGRGYIFIKGVPIKFDGDAPEDCEACEGSGRIS